MNDPVQDPSVNRSRIIILKPDYMASPLVKSHGWVENRAAHIANNRPKSIPSEKIEFLEIRGVNQKSKQPVCGLTFIPRISTLILVTESTR